MLSPIKQNYSISKFRIKKRLKKWHLSRIMKNSTVHIRTYEFEFLPSTHNYFGDVRVKRVLCDSGNSIPIEEDELDKMLSKHQSSCDFKMTSSAMSFGETSRTTSIQLIYVKIFLTVLRRIMHCPLCTDDIANVKLKYNSVRLTRFLSRKTAHQSEWKWYFWEPLYYL